MCDLVNHARFPKEDHLPDWARRDYQVKKGDRVHPSHTRVFSLLTLHHLVQNLSTKHKICKAICNGSLSYYIPSMNPANMTLYRALTTVHDLMKWSSFFRLVHSLF